MPHFRHLTTACAYRDRSSKGWRTRSDGTRYQVFHDCWRVEIYVNGERIRRYRSFAATKAEAIANATTSSKPAA